MLAHLKTKNQVMHLSAVDESDFLLKDLAYKSCHSASFMIFLDKLSDNKNIILSLLSVCMVFICLSLCLSVFLFYCLFVCVCLCVCLSVHLSGTMRTFLFLSL